MCLKTSLFDSLGHVVSKELWSFGLTFLQVLEVNQLSGSLVLEVFEDVIKVGDALGRGHVGLGLVAG